MMKLLKLIKQLFCDHVYGDGVVNPFIDEYDNHSAVYTCLKCEHKHFKTFSRK